MGLGDGGAHVGFILDAGYQTWMLTHWGRDQKRWDARGAGPAADLRHRARRRAVRPRRDRARQEGRSERHRLDDLKRRAPTSSTTCRPAASACCRRSRATTRRSCPAGDVPRRRGDRRACPVGMDVDCRWRWRRREDAAGGISVGGRAADGGAARATWNLAMSTVTRHRPGEPGAYQTFERPKTATSALVEAATAILQVYRSGHADLAPAPDAGPVAAARPLHVADTACAASPRHAPDRP